MGKNKLKRFAANQLADNIIQEGKPLFEQIKGNWLNLQFKNNNPIVLEIGCGNGEYTTGLAEVFPDKNFIGYDIKGARLFVGSQIAIEKKLKNVAFLRQRVEFILQYFSPNEVDEIWITFPDPHLKDKREKHRLTHPRFLDLYRQILKKDGVIHLKTDSAELTEYTLEVLNTLNIKPLILTRDLYKYPDIVALHKGIKTKYEKMYLAINKPINYIQFKLN
jgi:tRNA (guanine-N7-)-methyltransferase